MSIDKYLYRQYHPANYNCAHLVCEVWKEMTGIDITPNLAGFLSGGRNRTTPREMLKIFRRLDKPLSPCIVLMNPSGHRAPHAGIYIRGRVLHITADFGVMYQKLELVSIGFSTVRFYIC